MLSTLHTCSPWRRPLNMHGSRPSCWPRTTLATSSVPSQASASSGLCPVGPPMRRHSSSSHGPLSRSGWWPFGGCHRRHARCHRRSPPCCSRLAHAPPSSSSPSFGVRLNRAAGCFGSSLLALATQSSATTSSSSSPRRVPRTCRTVRSRRRSSSVSSAVPSSRFPPPASCAPTRRPS